MKCARYDNSFASCYYNRERVCEICFWRAKLNMPMSGIARAKTNRKIKKGLG